ncbi:MAG: NAD(P)H-quinone oxidoreductase [Proteobacteria bacterium]|nr:NAD(P)H-quinone oxidoreductase [Pseudomonadota bacterium]MDA1057539.1 NAD(P)H-quinone oxidoreductase [Pseudomonadota bacterium]
MTEMNVIEMDGRGAAKVMRLATRPIPAPGPGEVLIRTRAIGVNRVDILQRSGQYTPPYGIIDVPGVELSGDVAALGDGVTGMAVGDAVCGLIVGGAYAEYCAVPQTQVLRLPKDYDYIHGAALPEVHFTVWTALMQHGRYKGGESLLVHGGSSGIGTTAIMLARALGAGDIYATAGNAQKCKACEDLGAAKCVNYKTADFVEAIGDLRGDAGVDVILDMVVGPYVPKNQSLLAPDGRLVFIGLMSEQREVQINASSVMMKRQIITGVSLRGQSLAQKAAIRDEMEKVVWPLLDHGKMRPVIDSVYPMAEAVAAHKRLETSQHIGQIVLTVDPA